MSFSLQSRQYLSQWISVLPVLEMSLSLCGKAQKLRVRSAVALARFLKGQQVRVLRCRQT